ncbi:MAG: DUF4445 domain-containing protein [Candidatus Heimdallarchaeota archaeon]|nr:DUF4445 domain-containing protein [Candidatus Heimdallarchaeota archaeon]
MKQKRATVTFQPEGIIVEVPLGETILTATKKAGIILTIPCGGHGRCGKCKVLINKGQNSLKGDFHTKTLTLKEIEDGYRLACQTKVEGDLEIFIPGESRVISQKILSDSLPVKMEIAPVIIRQQLTIPQPEEHSNMADIDRLLVEIKKTFPHQQIIIPYENLQKLPKILRKKNWNITLTYQKTSTTKLEILEIQAGQANGSILGLAIDIGTTTIAASLIDLETGERVQTASCVNSQMLAGEDIITRIHYASANFSNLIRLQNFVIKDINNLIKSFDCKPRQIKALTLAANTVMTHLFFGIDPSYIWREPYTPAVSQFPTIQADRLGIKIHPLSKVRALPCVSSYVGGDIIGDILVSGLHQKDKPSIIVDIGTNGEIVLGCRSWLLSCSVPAGPALEGAEAKCGMRATMGAIERVTINPETLEPTFNIISAEKPLGICGSGLIDLIAELFQAGTLTKAGRFTVRDHSRIRKGVHGLEYLVANKEETITQQDIVLTERDISNLLRTKGAFYAGYVTLLKSFNLTFQDVDTFYVAGGFGDSINAKNARTIGLYPDIPLEKIKSIGNGALGGAGLTLLSEKFIDTAKRIAKSLTNIELSKNYDFMDEYTLASFIPHTHLDYFPTVQKLIETGGIKY